MPCFAKEKTQLLVIWSDSGIYFINAQLIHLSHLKFPQLSHNTVSFVSDRIMKHYTCNEFFCPFYLASCFPGEVIVDVPKVLLAQAAKPQDS